MSDRSNAPAEPIKRVINGEEYLFKELSYNDCAEFLREHRRGRREALKSMLKDSGLDPKQAYLELRTLDETDVGDYDWMLFFNSYDGKLKILTKALERAKPGSGSMAKEYGGSDIVELCGALTYTPVTYKSKNTQGDKKSPGDDPLARTQRVQAGLEEETPADVPKGFGTP